MSKIRQTVIETLSQQGPLPVEKIARAARVSIMAMRYHLTLLAREGLIVPQDGARRARVGRPPMMYALAEDAHERLPKKYHAIAGQLLDEMTETLGEKETRALLRRAGRHAATSAPPLRRGTGIQARLKRATKFLTERGFMARWEKSNDDLRLSVCNCPYRQVAQEHRQVCDMDVAMIGTLMDAPFKMTRCIARDDGRCEFVVSKKGLSDRK